jgi:mRNA interferase RelE/StbE
MWVSLCGPRSGNAFGRIFRSLKRRARIFLRLNCLAVGVWIGKCEFRPRAAEDFANLDQVVADRVLKRLRWLAETFDSIKPEPLTGLFSGLLKLRIGDYRVVYQADREKKVLRV